MKGTNFFGASAESRDHFALHAQREWRLGTRVWSNYRGARAVWSHVCRQSERDVWRLKLELADAHTFIWLSARLRFWAPDWPQQSYSSRGC